MYLQETERIEKTDIYEMVEEIIWDRKTKKIIKNENTRKKQ